jgi:hypothetical protein
MSGLKCRECGLVNFATAEICKRCGLSLAGDVDQADRESIPSGGVWQDKGLLVMRFDARLPQRCIKCNSELAVKYKVVRAIAYSHWKLPLFILGYQMIPRVLMARLMPHVKVEIALCKKHSSNWDRDLKITLPLILIGLGLLVASFYLYSFAVLFLGLLLFAIAVLSSVIGGDPVHLRRQESNYVWLKGAGPRYLAALPSFPGN